MSGILLIGTFVFLFFFGYHMVGLLDHFLDTNCFHPQNDDTESITQNDGLSSQDLTDFHHSAANRAS